MAQVQFIPEIETLQCPKGCCTMYVQPYKHDQPQDFRHKYKKSKAGACLYDMRTNRILLVQSRGLIWGCPKGTMEDCDKDIESCAIREVFEETGYMLNKYQLINMYKIDRAVYYIIPINEFAVTLQSYDPTNNDANGIGWIRIDCLKEMEEKNSLKLNSHCKKILSKFFK